jgi:two-component system NtrC family response regulator
MVHEDQFREDLMFRINTFEINIPPLRERIEDIQELSRHLLGRLRFPAASKEKPISPEALELLQAHVWPGNVRELANVIEYATILCDAPPILPEHLPQRFDARQLRSPGTTVKMNGPMTLREMEMQAIYAAIERHDGSKPKAAEELGVSLKTLYNKINQADSVAKAA